LLLESMSININIRKLKEMDIQINGAEEQVHYRIYSLTYSNIYMSVFRIRACDILPCMPRHVVFCVTRTT